MSSLARLQGRVLDKNINASISGQDDSELSQYDSILHGFTRLKSALRDDILLEHGLGAGVQQQRIQHRDAGQQEHRQKEQRAALPSILCLPEGNPQVIQFRP